MDIPYNKLNSQSRPQPRKLHYFTGDSTKNNLTASSIDQHRNSIEQRIANLQSKLAKKFSHEIELNTIPPHSDHYASTRRMYQNFGINNQNNNQPPSYSQFNAQNDIKQFSYSSGFLNTRQPVGKGSTFKYLANFDENIDEIALRQKSKFSLESNNNPHQHENIQSKDKLKSVLVRTTDKSITHTSQNPTNTQTKERLVGRKIKNVLYCKDQNGIEQNQSKYQSSQKFDRKYPLSNYPLQNHQPDPQKNTTTMPRSNPILNNRYIEDINQLNTNILNLKSSSAGSYPFENYQKPNVLQQKTISHDTGLNLRQTGNKNQLFEMMMSIMVGQERLEKELMMLKNSKLQEPKSIPQSHSKNPQGIRPLKQTDRGKFFSTTNNKNKKIPDSRLMSPIQFRQQQKNLGNIQSRSPKTKNRHTASLHINKSKSPARVNSSNPVQQIQAHKIKRVNSAAMGKKLPGKIQKNKQRFDELYKQAQLNKRLNESNSRMTVSNQVLSSVWEKIKQTIKRAESEDAETSVIYHENNRWVNDHLVRKIELQKKLKNDLIKKVYEMCENKCLFK